ncbi:uncharacterized protein [Rutidosis leptorrhynchoides]|uniref:uncharacterized protein n=1 Tax=Rutidosis leptorrhynchoides TaxID=125765 RepID=UPI003A9A195A
MDSTWMSKCRSTPEFEEGLDKFLERYKIPTVLLEPDDTLTWDAEDDMEGLTESIFHMFEDEDDVVIPETENQSNVPNINAERFYKVLGDAKKELYPDCKFSVLSFIVRLFHSKCVGKCNKKGFSMILDIMREAFPHASIPKSLYEVRKLIRELGLESTTQADNDGDYKAKKVGAKVLHYFPLIPWLQRLFMSPKTSESMRWHQESHTKDGILRHPTDSPAWKTFDHQNREFAKEPCNMRLGLASDGFNPFGNMSVSHSNNIDVYMQPLINELKELWDTGVNTYDASTKSNFPLHAYLLWTISDFPAYANLSGWSTKGKLACLSCHKETKSIRLSTSHKDIFMAHRRWLEMWHAFHFLKDAFEGTEEHEGPPLCLTGEKVLVDLKGFNIKFGKLVKDNPSLPFNRKKRNGKTKDHLKARHDLKEMGIRPELHPEPLPNGKVYLPPAYFVLDKKEKEKFCKVLKRVKVPDGYAANISRCIQVQPPKILGLKSHDNHILMQQLLPVAIRNILPHDVRSVIMKLCRYYRQLCSKVLKTTDLIRMEKDIVKILCDLERIFSPSFFDVMIHLSVHLASEDRLGGPVHYRWMYPIERYLGTIKSYVRNRSKPEGSIAEGYLAEECVSFCTLYLASDVETIHNKTSQNHDDGGDETVLPIFCMSGRPISATNVVKFGHDTLAITYSHVLFNCSEIDFLRTEHLNILRQEYQTKSKRYIECFHSREFQERLTDYVDEDMAGDNRIINDITALGNGPYVVVKKNKGYIINGFRFHIKDVEKNRTTQNSEVMIDAVTSSFSSASDNNPILGDVTYYGILYDIIELQYADNKQIVLFHCDWISGASRIKLDENGFTTLDFRGMKLTKEPYILALQAQQVFYVQDRARKG